MKEVNWQVVYRKWSSSFAGCCEDQQCHHTYNTIKRKPKCILWAARNKPHYKPFTITCRPMRLPRASSLVGLLYIAISNWISMFKGLPDSKPWGGSLNIVVHGKHSDHAAVVFRKDTPEKNSPGTEHALTCDMWLLDLRHVDESGDKLNVYYARRDEIKYKKLIQLCGIKDVGFSIRHLAVQFT